MAVFHLVFTQNDTEFVDVGARDCRRKPFAYFFDISHCRKGSRLPGCEEAVLPAIELLLRRVLRIKVVRNKVQRGIPGLWFAGFRKYSNIAGFCMGYASEIPMNLMFGSTARMAVTTAS